MNTTEQKVDLSVTHSLAKHCIQVMDKVKFDDVTHQTFTIDDGAFLLVFRVDGWNGPESWHYERFLVIVDGRKFYPKGRTYTIRTNRWQFLKEGTMYRLRLTDSPAMYI